MSVISGRSSLVTIVRNSLGHRNSFIKDNFRIIPQKIESALNDLIQKKDSRPYEELVCVLRDCTLTDDDLTLVLSECSLCVGLMGREARLLVEVLCCLDWPTKPERIVDLFNRWLLDLLTAQIYHAPLAIGSLVKLLSKSDSVWCTAPSEEQTTLFSNVHSLIARVVAIIPMSGEVLLQCAIDNFPYHKHSIAVNQSYVHNLLWMTRYLPALTDHLLTVILNRLIIMDVNIKTNVNHLDDEDGDVFTMDYADNDSDHLVECLDVCMLELFQWFHQEGPKVSNILFSVFERTLLPTYGTRNVQFVILYGLSMDVTRISYLLESLWKMVVSARVGPSLRQASIAHLVGLLARANFIPPAYINNYIKKMSDWCHSYILAQDSPHSQSGNNPHGVFHCVCQSLFYLIAFKHNYIFSTKKGSIFVDSLNLPKIVMCSLNPLRVCQSAVAEAFASITRIHQVVYCHTIMEHNTRNCLRISDEATKEQDWFPYDPYTLPRSFSWIKPLYSEYEDTLNDLDWKKADVCDDDDFLAMSPNTELSNSLSKCSFASFRQL